MNIVKYDFNESFDNFNRAMIGIPDRIPVFAQIHEFAMVKAGFNPPEFYTDPQKLVYGLLEVHKKYGLDAPYVDYDVYNIEAQGLGQRIIFKNDGVPDIDRSDYLIKSPDDLKKITKPNFKKDGRFPFAIKCYEYFYEMTSCYSVLNFCAPFSLAANIRGIENVIFDIMENPNFARELFKRITHEVLIPWIGFMEEHFSDAPSIVGSDATASLPILNIEMLEEWVIPYIEEIRNIFGDKVYVSNWVGDRYLKDPVRMFNDKLRVCSKFLEGQDPDVEALGPEVYKNYAVEKNVSLVLGVGAAFLARATPGEIRKRVKRYLEVGKPVGKFAIYLCNIGASTPEENLIAAIDTVKEYGKYD